MSEILDGLNDEQRRVAEHVNGPLLVVAGAGSGKTRALTHRIAHLIVARSIPAKSIVAVTFTNKAAGELTERIEKLISTHSGGNQLPVSGTFHSLCCQLLRRHMAELGRENTFTIFDTADQKAAMKQAAKAHGFEAKNVPISAVLSVISKWKSSLFVPESVEATGPLQTQAKELWAAYEDILKKANALDFDDLLVYAHRLFATAPALAERYGTAWQYVCVDEYQDTNYAQAALLKQLTKQHNNIAVIGDPDQSIYSWRGADIHNIHGFTKEYPKATVVTLNQNYRSTGTILSAANAVISGHQYHEKKLWTENTEGAKVERYEAADEYDEAGYVAARIEASHKSGMAFSDSAVLYRTNAQSRVLEELLLRNSIPYKIIGGQKFYERQEIKDMCAYMRVIVNPRDTVSLLRIINTPRRGIGDKTIEALMKKGTPLESAANAETLGLPARATKALQDFAALIADLTQKAKKRSVPELIEEIMVQTGLEKSWQLEGDIAFEARKENVGELINQSKRTEGLAPPLGLITFLEEVALLTDADRVEAGTDAALLMTLHAAKGLEFNQVFLVGLEEGLLPGTRAMTDATQMAEERRLLYVGVTRAEKKLHMSYATRRMLFGQQLSAAPSSFLDAIPLEIYADAHATRLARNGYDTTPLPSELPEFQAGDKVTHAQFGAGVVKEITGGIIAIAFNDATVGLKRLAISIAPISKAD